MGLRLALLAADLVARSVPAPVAYALADLGGRLWYRASPARRRVVEENLRRVCAATGRPERGRAFRSLVRRAFVEHARYYLELLRAPHYPMAGIERHVVAEDWDRWVAVFRGGAVVALPHLGNFEPYGTFVVKHGIRAVAPVEEIRPRALFDFLRARRASGRVELVPLSRARGPLLAALRRGEVAALVADRDLTGDGIAVTLFGHPVTLPAGPASLALITGRPLIGARCLRVGPDRFSGRAWLVDVPRTGERRRDIEALTRALARGFEEAIAEAPEQWWGAFQPFWPDLRSAERRRLVADRTRARGRTAA
ncbi:MAG TPA: hypothetical protein VHK06_07905 [Candidatus Limnocylindria bacterium]|nr:hypothetical protein [Candidatus Limnocylindria bacterium]